MIIYVVLVAIPSIISSCDYALRLAMDNIFVIELERRNAIPVSLEYQNLTFLRDQRIAQLPNGLFNVSLSPQAFARGVCNNWPSEIIQLHLLFEARYYIDSYRLFLSLHTNSLN